MDLLHSRSHFGFIGLGLIGGSVARLHPQRASGCPDQRL